MKYPLCIRRGLACVLALALSAGLALPASAFFWKKKQAEPAVSGFTRNVLAGDTLNFSPQDFVPTEGYTLAAITVKTLPDAAAGVLTIGQQALIPGAVVDASALSGLSFQSSAGGGDSEASFTFTPTFTSGAEGPEAKVTIVLLTQENQAPIARNMDLSTYKNVALTGWFDAVDSEGDVLTFQLTSTPARGAVTMAEDGSSQFVYTPYENKTGKDSFTYVAIDPAGNTSPEAKVTIRIDKPSTKVTYADMEGDPAHKAAIRLAEEGIYVGSYRNGEYFFQPEQAVSRGEFLSLAMSVAGLEPLEGVSVTGFYDDEAIPTWCKGYVSSALKAGVVRGTAGENGQPVFAAGDTVTRGEAAVMLNSLLNVADVSVETFAAEAGGHWASQAAANLAASGVIRSGDACAQAMSGQLTRAEVAELLDGALDVLAAREENGWLPF